MAEVRDLNHAEGFMNPMMYEDEFNHFMATLDSLPDSANIVEFGSGGSTYQIGQRLKERQDLFSIEHNPEWFAKVRNAVRELPAFGRIHRTLSAPTSSIQQDGFARPQEETPTGVTNYIHPSFKIPLDWLSVNLVLVDGIARGACLAALRSKLAPRTTVFLHDYKGREDWYEWAVKLYEHVSLTNTLLELRVP
jgi:hypothetical protein